MKERMIDRKKKRKKERKKETPLATGPLRSCGAKRRQKKIRNMDSINKVTTLTNHNPPPRILMIISFSIFEYI